MNRQQSDMQSNENASSKGKSLEVISSKDINFASNQKRNEIGFNKAKQLADKQAAEERRLKEKQR